MVQASINSKSYQVMCQVLSRQAMPSMQSAALASCTLANMHVHSMQHVCGCYGCI
jgi:hypothetical protein